MGRNKEYDAREKLGQAVSLFRKTGFSATSTAELVEHLGINRKSMYAEFGSKEQLFDAALQLYSEEAIEEVFGPLETSHAGVAEIDALLAHLGAGARGPSAGLGCLLCNTAVERAPRNKKVRKHVRSYVRRIAAAFENALANGGAAGDVAASVDIAAQARFFTGHVLGQLTLIRANVAPDVVESAAAVAYEHLRALAGDLP